MTVSETTSATRVTVIRPPRGLQINIRELVDFRELLGFLVWRDVKVRYKQTAIGVAWALLQPLAAMLVFTLVFGRVGGIRPAGIPYPVFVYAGLVPWTYFSSALTSSSNSLVANTSLVTKVYFPRVIIPVAAVLVPVVDLALSLLLLGGLMGWYGVAPDWTVVFVPVFLVLELLTALGIGLLLSAVNVRYRDVPYAIPFLLQIWMFASPVIYPVAFVPDRWQWVLSLNPMTGVLEGLRWALLDQPAPPVWVVGVSVGVALVVTVAGVAYFRVTERYFADVI